MSNSEVKPAYSKQQKKIEAYSRYEDGESLREVMGE